MSISFRIFGLVCLALILQMQYALGQKRFKVEKLGPQINTRNYDEISPVISLEGEKLYFTRVGYPEFRKTLIEDGEDLSQTMEQPKFNRYLRDIFSSLARHSIFNVEKSAFNQDVWLAYKDNGSYNRVEHPTYPLNNALPNSVCSLTPSENELVVINQFQEEGGMKKGFSVVRQNGDGTWTFPTPMVINNYHNSGPDVSMTMSHDGSVIILSMQREDSYGRTDLYISFNLGNDTWTTPKNMGRTINSNRKETTPFLTPDNNTLFFSSNRGGSLGGNDIFIMKRVDEDWNKWTRPQRLVKPINSKQDDSQPYFDLSSGYLYFTSRRDGSSDIFKVKLGPPIPVLVSIKGKIINTKTGDPVPAKVLSGIVDGRFKNTYISDDGTFNLKIPKGVDYTIVAEVPGHVGKKQTINFNKNHIFYKEYTYNLEVEPIEPGMKIETDPIYFEQSKAIVLKKSYPALDKLADHLKDHPTLYVKIEGHTDNQGDRKALIKLSEKRAEAIKEYLVYQKRVNPVRIETVGIGPDQPVNDNSSSDLRSMNRRVEVIVTSSATQVLGLQSDGEK